MKRFFTAKKSLLVFMIAAHCSQLVALDYDFGLILNQYAEYGNDGTGDTAFEYKGAIVPRISFPVGQNGEIFISGSFSIGYEEELYYYPELMRTEYNMRSGSWGFKIGRINYSDPIGYIATGLFDGFQATYMAGVGRFGLGAWYTGFIFKKSAHITMTDNDEDLYNRDLDYGDFSNTYFGSSRAFAALEWEHPSIAEILRLKIALLGQFDLNDVNTTINSQYVIFKMGLPFNNLFLEAGGSFSLMQKEISGKSTSEMAFAFDFGVNWTLPTSFYSRLAFAGYYTSGSINEQLAPFTSMSTVFLGNIFQVKRTAVTAICLDYSLRASQSLGLSLTAVYFVQNDLVTGIFVVDGTAKNEFFLGPELYAKAAWSPFSDLQIIIGGGAFLPFLGNNWPDGKVQWRVDLSAILAIF